jgi:hypothetical protein
MNPCYAGQYHFFKSRHTDTDTVVNVTGYGTSGGRRLLPDGRGRGRGRGKGTAKSSSGGNEAPEAATGVNGAYSSECGACSGPDEYQQLAGRLDGCRTTDFERRAGAVKESVVKATGEGVDTVRMDGVYRECG